MSADLTTDARHAPIIFTNGAAGLGYLDGVVTLTLGALIQTSIGNGEVQADGVVVAHLRMNVQGALSIKKAIESALLLASPSEGQAN